MPIPKTIKIVRKWAMPNSKTFSILPIKNFIEEHIQGAKVIVDPFANDSTYGTITNDLNPEFNTTYHLDALEFMRKLDSGIADVVLYDPPYSVTQASQCYKSYGKNKLSIGVSNAKYWSLLKKEISRVVKKDGICISFGWNSNGIGMSNGMKILEILLVPHGGSHYDTIVTLEKKL